MRCGEDATAMEDATDAMATDAMATCASAMVGDGFLLCPALPCMGK